MSRLHGAHSHFTHGAAAIGTEKSHHFDPASPSRGGAYCGDVSDCGDEEEPSSIVICFEGDHGDGIAFEEDDDVATCCICLERYEHHNPASHMRCGHHFHVPCLLGWQQRSMQCPLCQAPLDSTSSPQEVSRRRRMPSPALFPPQSGTYEDSGQRRSEALTTEAMEQIIHDLRLRTSPRELAAGDPTVPRVLLHLSIEAEMRRQRRERRKRRSRDLARLRRGEAGEAALPDQRRLGVTPPPPAGEWIEMVEVVTEMNDGDRVASVAPRRSRPRRQRQLPADEAADPIDAVIATAQRRQHPPAGIFARFFSCCTSTSAVTDVDE